MADRLNEPESRFHASLVTSQELNRFATQIRNRLCAYPAHELKKSDILRVAIASDSATLLDEMDTVMR
jgi:hypothetical protein